ncbi:MAG: hypothetical protein IPK99_15820 [Flavobacteriales bacterium]|nr:hypothetical protein [Flavobacteriales bacterium]
MASFSPPVTALAGFVRKCTWGHSAIVVFATCGFLAPVLAQDQGFDQYVARIAPVVQGHSPKPMIGELTAWLPDTEIAYAQAQGILHLRTTAAISLLDLRAHTEPNGFLVLSLSAETHGQTSDRTAAEMPADSAAMHPLDDAARVKAEWIEMHRENYEMILENGSGGDHAK